MKARSLAGMNAEMSCIQIFSAPCWIAAVRWSKSVRSLVVLGWSDAGGDRSFEAKACSAVAAAVIRQIALSALTLKSSA
jgi:hypothetical protein